MSVSEGSRISRSKTMICKLRLGGRGFEGILEMMFKSNKIQMEQMYLYICFLKNLMRKKECPEFICEYLKAQYNSIEHVLQ